ncbi:MAG TPA: hypothetical protein VIH57_12305 [Bacteroidales bacterium]
MVNGDTTKNSHTLNPRDQFLKIGASAGWFAVRDYETSPLIYRGLLPGFQIGTFFQGPKMIILFDYNFSYGSQATRNYPIYDGNLATAYNNILNISVAHHISLGVNAKTKLYLGGNFGMIANFRDNLKFNNANFNYEGFATFGPMVLFEKELNLLPHHLNMAFFRWPLRNRTLKLSTSLSVPVIGLVSRLPYTTIGDFVDGVSPSFSFRQLKPVSFDYLFNLISTSSVSYYLRNGNRFMLSYQWYYYNYYPSINQVRGVAGIFAISFLFRLNKM